MLILSENGRKLIYKVMANTSGRNETMMTFTELKDAEEFVKKVASKYGAVS